MVLGNINSHHPLWRTFWQYLSKCKVYKLFDLKSLLNLVGWHWLIKLNRFQVCNCTAHHLCTVLWVHYPKISLHHHSLPFILFTSPPPFPFGNHHTVIGHHESFSSLLNSVTFSLCPQSLPLWLLSVCSLCPWVCRHFVSLFCALDSTCNGNHMELKFYFNTFILQINSYV